jgi:hypothetical protein
MSSPRDLLPQVYDELRRLAAARLAQERPGHILDATTRIFADRCAIAGSSGFRDEAVARRMAPGSVTKICFLNFLAIGGLRSLRPFI